MSPIQILRVTLGNETVAVPIYRLPYSGRDSFAAPGGFFTDHEGAVGIVVDARLSPADMHRIVTEEIQKNGVFLAAALAAGRSPLSSESHPPS